jgi:hypothetical protein
METVLIVVSCACLVIGLYFFFVRPRATESPPRE